VEVPEEARERTRSLVRCRETLRREVGRSKQHVLKHVMRCGQVYRGGKFWTRGHFEWLRSLSLGREDDIVLQSHLTLLDVKQQLVDERDADIAALAQTEPYRDVVGRLECLRGVRTLTAMALAVELGDVGRFASPRELMGYVGLGVSEQSSGSRERRGSITKAGNAHVRRLLVEAAWQATFPPRRSVTILRRREGKDPRLVAHAVRAERRLHRRYSSLVLRMPPTRAVTAVARELVGFVWSMMQNDPQRWSSRGR
jgi:transposase